MASLARPDAIVFDVYDTLFANSDDGWRRAFGAIIDEQELPIDSAELWRRWKKYERRFRTTRTNMEDPADSPPFKTYEQSWAECFQRVFDEGDIEGDAAAAARRSVEHMAHRDPFPEMVSAVNELAGRVRLAIFSNADEDFLRPLLDSYALPFEGVASSESARVYKPSPFAYKHILELIGVKPDQAWYVGDHPFDDVYGAHLAGMTTVWVNRSGERFEGEVSPDATVGSLTELTGLLDIARSAQESARPSRRRRTITDG